MKLAKLLAAWGLVAAVGFFAAERFVYGRVGAEEASVILASSVWIFGVATATLAVVFRQLDVQPPKELDAQRQARQQRKFNARWAFLWVRWVILALATGSAAFAGKTLDSDLWLTEKQAIGVGGASLSVGVLATAISILENVRLRRFAQEQAERLAEAKRKHDFLNPPEPPKATDQKPARA